MKRRVGFSFVVSAALVLTALLLGGLEMRDMLFFRERTTEHFDMTSSVASNPLIGFAPPANNPSVAENDSLVYVDITWEELEPEEGIFDFSATEQANYLKRWREEGKHVVLRFVTDYPQPEEHRDIPDWLYEKTEGDGTVYAHSYGKGYAPNYANPVFIESHAKAIQALGEQYGNDTFISYIQLGSLGHWGEWHVNVQGGVPPLPAEDIRDQYVFPYIEAFPNAKLLMRRPFRIAKAEGLGLYNDMAGHPQSTQQWMEWITQGGVFDQTGEEALAAMPRAWQTAPIGGELTSALPMGQMLTTHLERTLQLLRESHASFVGPNIPSETGDTNNDYRNGMTQVLQTLGYRIGVTHMEWTERSNRARVKLTWENHGIAPLYWDWPVYLYFTDMEGNVLGKEAIDLRLTQLLPGKTIKTTTDFQLEEPSGDVHAVSVGIEDPMTGRPAVQLASNQEKNGNLALLKVLGD
ncbi:DUF4832 domain-containing protein [Atopococcus tabaci]|uniref:DUF4832 domain-containing protein n=1 Tax=Atopococcus tabaci TaxID=269774 RepID=UPI00240900C9|nr:DUF4832 domain-containing protein [Atopococcus tabaci]